jgi:hypothetical protein
MAFIFEGEFDFRAIGIDFAVADNNVLFHDFGYAQLAQMFSGLLDRILGSIFPTLGAGAYELDNVVRALRMDNLMGALGHTTFSLDLARLILR